MKTSDQILTEARELIRAGWVQNDYYIRDDGGRDYYCALGALHKAAAGRSDELPPLPSRLGGAYYDAYMRLTEAVGGHVILWNDRPERTQEEVVEAFDRAMGDGG